MKQQRLISILAIAVSLVFSSGTAFSQWSTSTRTDSALYVCPGFYPFLLTFGDGSSIVFGSHTGFIKARKLDPRGYFLWPEPVSVVEDESTLVTQHWGGAVDDGRGGAIICYVDYGRSYVDGGGYENNDLYLQHIDSMGNPLWGSRGKLIADTSTGKKSPSLCVDGNGGCILTWTSSSFRFPGAPDSEYVCAQHVDPDGGVIWRSTLDSASSFLSFQSPAVQHVGEFVFIECYFNGNYVTYLLNGIGQPLLVRSSGSVVRTEWNNSHLFVANRTDSLRFSKIDSQLELEWTVVRPADEFCDVRPASFPTPLVSDGLGGVMFTRVCGDSVLQIDSNGSWRYTVFEDIARQGRYIFSDGKKGLVAVEDDGTSIHYRDDGRKLYEKYPFISDPNNSYFEEYRSDFHGGVIAAFWTTAGGIYAQHTGRNGKPGIIDAVKFSDADTSPQSVELMQNYPNPFNPRTTIVFTLPSRSDARLAVYDILGRRLRTLFDGIADAGTHTFVFNAEDLASGVYVCRIVTPGGCVARRMTLQK